MACASVLGDSGRCPRATSDCSRCVIASRFAEREAALAPACPRSAPPVVKQTAVGHLVGQAVLEGVLEIGEEPRFVEELGGLKLGQAPAQRLLG
jgi:hypothetical protein